MSIIVSLLLHAKTAAVVTMAVKKMFSTRHLATRWSNKNSHMQWPVSLLLNANAMLCVFLTVYKFTAKELAPLYFIWACAQISFQASFLILVYASDIESVREKGAKYADNLFKFIGIQIGVLIFGMFWFSSCSTLIYPVAFSVTTICFIASYMITKDFNYEWLDVKEPKQKEAKEQFDQFFGKYKQMMIWHAVEFFYGNFILSTLGGSTCEADGSDWELGAGPLMLFNHIFDIMHLLGSAQSFGEQTKIFALPSKEAKEALI